MSKVMLITDSTVDFPPEVLRQYDNIRVVPQSVNWDQATYRDGIDIQPGEFYRQLGTSKSLPTTSQVSPQLFKQVFQEALDSGYEVLAVLIAKELSGTMDSALQAREMLPDAPVEIIDSRTTVMSMGFQILHAARAAQQGAGLAECKQLATEAIEHTGVLFAVDTLEFLYRGGRIGGAARLLGTALNLKPVLEIVNGRVEPVERVRTRKKSLARLVDLAEERIAGRQPQRFCVLHAEALEDAECILDEVTRRFRPVETLVSELSPVIGTHTGPGTLGLAFMAGE